MIFSEFGVLAPQVLFRLVYVRWFELIALWRKALMRTFAAVEIGRRCLGRWNNGPLVNAECRVAGELVVFRPIRRELLSCNISEG